MWHDHGNFEEHLKGLQSFQYYSHLPGLSFFARKVEALFGVFEFCRLGVLATRAEWDLTQSSLVTFLI